MQRPIIITHVPIMQAFAVVQRLKTAHDVTVIESKPDPRHIVNGRMIPTEHYCDQPFVVKTDDGAWLCCVTTGAGHEGAQGQHVTTMRSTDCGKTWSAPVPVEQQPYDVENSYAVMLKASAGRVYIFYNHNTDNVREVKRHDGEGAFERVDSLGHFVFKYSDDHGRSWSEKRYDIPFRLFQCDRDNIYGGELCFFWNVGKPFTHEGAAFVSLHKIGQMGEGFMQQSEGVLLKSDNLLSESDPDKITWKNLPAAVQDALHTGEHTNQKRARELMAELITADLIALATALREAVHEISPTTRLGLMYPTHMMGVEQVARALAGDHQPFVRPQIPLYREDVPTMAYPSRFQTVDIWQAQLPADFEFYPEGENYPYDPALKSPSAALLHHMYCLAVGESQVALSLNSFSAGIPACESTALVDKFTAYRGQIATVNELLDTDRQTIKTVGATVWQHSEASQLGLLEGPNLLPLQARGVPVSYVRNPEDAVLHWGNSLAHLSDEELEGVLQRGAVFDGRAVEILEQRGLLESTGLSLGEKCRVTDVLHIRYERNDQGHENWPFYYFVSRMPGDDHLPRRMSAPDSTTICPYLDDKGNISAPHILTWTSPSGVRFGLLNVLASRLDKALLSPWSTPAIVRAIEWVQDAPLTACAAGGGNVLLKALRLRSGSQLMLTLANLSTSPSSPLPIRLAPKYVTWRWSKVGANGEREPLEVNSKGQLPAPLLQCLEHSIFLGECLSERDRTAMKLPIDYLAHPETDARLRKHLGVTTENELLDALGSDFFYLPGRDISQNEGFLPFYKKRDSLAMSATERTCPLGIRWQRGAYDSKFAVDEALAGPFGNPMVSSREILDYPWPRAEDFDFSPLIDVAERNRDRTRIGGLWTGIMGDSYRMHGFENFLLNLAMNPDIVHTLIDRMTEMYLELNNAYFSTLKGNLEIWFFGNDFGSQESLLMSVDMWADYFYDNIRKLCALAHSYGLRVMMHSCGAIRELIPLLIEAGVDILDPIQVTAKGMEPDTLATEFGGRITFHGGIDTQRVLPTATPGDVTDHVRHTVATLGATGRYIFAPSQILGPDIPVENIAAMYRAARALNTERVTITDYA